MPKGIYTRTEKEKERLTKQLIPFKKGYIPYKFHRRYGIKNNFDEQLIEFISN